MTFSESIKKEVRKKAHYQCCLCRNIGVEIHHIIPFEENGENTINNAAPLCPTCHELYGSNPSKRKLITEARDTWYEICQKRYAHNGDIIHELKKSVDNLISSIDIKKMKIEVASEVLSRLKEVGICDDKIEDNGMPINKVVERILRYEKELDVPNQGTYDVTYALLFKARNDETADDKEYNEMRDKFLEMYGELVAKSLCRYIINLAELDWIQGVTDEQLSGALFCNFSIMMALIYHADLSTEDIKILIDFDNKGMMMMRLKEI